MALEHFKNRYHEKYVQYKPCPKFYYRIIQRINNTIGEFEWVKNIIENKKRLKIAFVLIHTISFTILL